MRERFILLVEDNADDETLMRRALEQNRIVNRLVVARDGAEARDFLFGLGAHGGRDISDVPQLILLDLKLPKIDGLDVLRRIRAHDVTRLVPVVILTSSLQEEDLIRGYGLGANSYVRKPVDHGKFIDAVREMALYWLVINEGPPTTIEGSARAAMAAR